MTTLLTAERLIDGTGRPPVTGADAAVLLDGDRITAVGADAREAVTGTDHVHHDRPGATLMPGLIDAHVHCTFDDVQSNDELFFHRDPTLAALIAGQNLTKLLLAGVTSIMDPDTLFEMGPALRDAVEAGVVSGPRISTGVSALLTSVGGTAGRLIPDEGEVGYARIVNDRNEAITWTRRHIKMGADWIKVHVTGRIPTRSGELTVWSREELLAVCETAHALDTPVAAHCRDATSTRLAAECGVDLILHASFMDEAGLEAIVEGGSALCPTFTFLANLADHGEKVGAGVGMADIFRGEIEATGGMMRRASEAGVPILCGSESGFALTPYGHWHAREMEVFVDVLDMSPVEAIRCATQRGAIAMRREGELGVLAPDHLADVICVEGDPSTDVTILGDRSRLLDVWSRGEAVDLGQPWPERHPLPGDKVANWADAVLTREAAGLTREG